MSAISWFDDFEGVAYRYYDIRMNVVPLISDRKKSAYLWHDTIRYWIDPSIKIRFVETGDKYWFIMGADSQKPESNLSFYKVLHKSEHYERFKKGHGGEAYLRLGTYSRKSPDELKKGKSFFDKFRFNKDDEDDEFLDDEDSDWKKNAFQVNMLKRKKTITDIQFLTLEDAKDDPLVQDCFNANNSSESQN